MKKLKVAVLGTAGIPASYGGFETLVENLIKFHQRTGMNCSVGVYCSGTHYSARIPKYMSARLHYVPLNANGPQSVMYDIWSILSAIKHEYNVILLLGVSGAILLPFIRLFSSVRVVTNIDGIEWRRSKWHGFARMFLRLSEYFAIRFSERIIADNSAILDYIASTYGIKAELIPYGGEQALEASMVPVTAELPISNYALSICRIEPENNIELILQAFSKLGGFPIVLVGNWSSSDFGRQLKNKYSFKSNLYLLDPIYDLGRLKHLRFNCSLYIHGHSAGGTNPSLVEIMHFSKPVIAFDCDFNRATTEEKAVYFRSPDDLVTLVLETKDSDLSHIGNDMGEIARRRYTWDIVARQYFALLCGV